jgi:transcriptional regulator of acetoin/glycerol metabolism
MHHALLYADENEKRLRRRDFGPGDMRALCERSPVRLAIVVVGESACAAVMGELPSTLRPPRAVKGATQGLRRQIARGADVSHIAAIYSGPGQAARSVKALWAEDDNPPRGVVVLEVPDGLYEALDRWLAHPAGEAPAASPAYDPASVQAFIARHIADVEVPADLVTAYCGRSAAVDEVRKLTVLAATSDCPVLILGETGTGKEVVARQIHKLSARRPNVFVPVNCSAIPDGLAESELFGHVRGAFTGALTDKMGLWTYADRGTLFLDEIGDLPWEQQAKTLRVLEDGRYRPIGGLKEIESHPRIIAATHRDLSDMVRTGQFREDLYHRLACFPIRTPALREHPADIPVLAQYFWRDIKDDRNASLPAEVLDELRGYAWPGNARGIKAFLIRLSVVARQKVPTVELVRDISVSPDRRRRQPRDE